TPTSPGTSNRRALKRTRAPTHACALPHRLLCNSRIRGMPEVGGDGTHLCCVSRHGKWVVERPGVPRQRRSGRGRAVIEFAGGAKRGGRGVRKSATPGLSGCSERGGRRGERP